MSNPVKILIYAVLVILAGLSGYFALTNFGHLMARGVQRGSDLEQIEPERKPPDNPAESATNATASTNAVATGTAASSNAVPAVTDGRAESATSNNAVAAQGASATNQAKTETAEGTATPVRPTNAKAAPRSGHTAVWTALFILSLVGLGLFIANDVSHFLGNRALKMLYNEEGEGVKNPEYEQAEQVWANGQHLEAINMMREYLKRNPREQYVALRIAEIYEKDLGNFLAAALEYEEVLKQKLPPERWGWAAIHLCNLYFKLNQEQKAFDLLRRIVTEYPTVAAAEKARKRLEQIDGTIMTEQLLTEVQVNAAPRQAANTPAPAQGTSNLPPGFRPKK